MDLGRLLFSFQGRINRAKFWLAVLIYFAAAIVALLLGAASNSEVAGPLLYNLVSLVSFISGIFVAIKRLHDRNRSGWWLLLFYIAPGALMSIGAAIWFVGVFGETSGAGGAGAIFMLAGAAVGIWGFVELGCLRGTVGPNQNGPDPLDQAAAPVPAR